MSKLNTVLPPLFFILLLHLHFQLLTAVLWPCAASSSTLAGIYPWQMSRRKARVVLASRKKRTGDNIIIDLTCAFTFIVSVVQFPAFILDMLRKERSIAGSYLHLNDHDASQNHETNHLPSAWGHHRVPGSLILKVPQPQDLKKTPIPIDPAGFPIELVCISIHPCTVNIHVRRKDPQVKGFV